MRCTALLLVALSLSAIPRAQDEGLGRGGPPNPKPAAAERYPYLYEFPGFAKDTPEIRAKLPLERLILRRGGCLGSCPVYTVELRRDGSAHYTGGEHAPRQGEFEGRTYLFEYALLCAAAEDLDLEGMEGRYLGEWSDDESVVLEWERDGKLHRIDDYARQAPPAFQAYRALIDEVASGVKWKPVEEKR